MIHWDIVPGHGGGVVDDFPSISRDFSRPLMVSCIWDHPMPSQKLSSNTRGRLLFGCFCFGTGTVGALGDVLGSWPWYLDKNLQLIELLSLDGRGGRTMLPLGPRI